MIFELPRWLETCCWLLASLAGRAFDHHDGAVRFTLGYEPVSRPERPGCHCDSRSILQPVSGLGRFHLQENSLQI